MRAFWWDFGVEMEPDSIREMNEANGAFAPYQGRNSYRHDMPDNERCNNRLIVGAKEESFDSGNDEQEIPSRWDKS